MTWSVDMARMGRWFVVAACLACGDAGDAGDDRADTPCAPGATLACECGGGDAGVQTCQPDGVGYDPCVCDGASDSSGGDLSGGDPSGVASTVDPSAGDGSGDTTAGTADPTDTNAGSESGDAVPQFQDDVVPILYGSCGAGTTTCHARNAYFPDASQGCRGWLSLENVPLGSSFDDLDPATQMPSEGPVPGCDDRDLHARLLELAPWECGADARYVVPGSPEQSYIFAKLTDGSTCGAFRVMPPPEEGYEITDAERETLAAWIAAGALP